MNGSPICPSVRPSVVYLSLYIHPLIAHDQSASHSVCQLLTQLLWICPIKKNGEWVGQWDSYRWKAEHNMKVVLHTSDEVVIKILVGRWSLRILSLHYTNQILSYFIDLISSKQVGHLRVKRQNYQLARRLLCIPNSVLLGKLLKKKWSLLGWVSKA